MSPLAIDIDTARTGALALSTFGGLTATSRAGGQGRVYRPELVPDGLACDRVVVKRYRVPPGDRAAQILSAMVRWRASLDPALRTRLDEIAAWPLATVTARRELVGIAMRDARPRFEVDFTMPSGRCERVLVGLEHLLGGDGYLRQRGLDVTLDTRTRARVAATIAASLEVLHRHGIVASDIAPNNILISFSGAAPRACFIDCDSMVFHGRQALAQVETADWNMPAHYGEPPLTRAADGYKLGLVILRLLVRSHAARTLEPSQQDHLPQQLRALLARALSEDARNRPAAGEWVRALRTTVDAPELERRRPGPPLPPRRAPRPATAPNGQAGPTAPPTLPRRPRRATRQHTTFEMLRGVLVLVAVIFCGFVLIRIFTLAAGGSGTPTTSSVQGPSVYPQQPGGRPQNLGGPPPGNP